MYRFDKLEINVINIQTTFPGNENLKRVWAPQTIYDAKEGKYLIYLVMQHAGGPDKIYYAYANKDFTALETAPKLLFVQNQRELLLTEILSKKIVYHLFYKTEGGKAGIKVATTTNLLQENGQKTTIIYSKPNDGVEGSSVFKLNNSDDYILMYDLVYERKISVYQNQRSGEFYCN